jgi:hypothetical protein
VRLPREAVVLRGREWRAEGTHVVQVRCVDVCVYVYVCMYVCVCVDV